MSHPDFYTATMAGVYAQQGHYQKAAEIYRHILSNEPDRQDIAAALSMVEQKLAPMKSESEKHMRNGDLVHLFQKWFQMAAGQGRIASLKRLKQRISARR